MAHKGASNEAPDEEHEQVVELVEEDEEDEFEEEDEDDDAQQHGHTAGGLGVGAGGVGAGGAGTGGPDGSAGAGAGGGTGKKRKIKTRKGTGGRKARSKTLPDALPTIKARIDGVGRAKLPLDEGAWPGKQNIEEKENHGHLYGKCLTDGVNYWYGCMATEWCYRYTMKVSRVGWGPGYGATDRTA